MTFFFFFFAAVAVVSAVLLVLFRNPIYSALSLVTTLFCVAGLFLLLDAHFLAAAQVIVYAGAIMVLFLFVLMLLNLGHPGALESMPGRLRRVCVLLAMALLAGELGYLAAQGMGEASAPQDPALVSDNVAYIGKLLYTDYLLPFEVVSVILLVALVGIVVLVKRERQKPEQPQMNTDEHR